MTLSAARKEVATRTDKAIEDENVSGYALGMDALSEIVDYGKILDDERQKSFDKWLEETLAEGRPREEARKAAQAAREAERVAKEDARWDGLTTEQKIRENTLYRSRRAGKLAYLNPVGTKWKCFYCQTRFDQYFDFCSQCFLEDVLLPEGELPKLATVKK
jgi:hypothetical protein